MPTHKSAGESELRDYFVALYCDLRQSYVNTARRGSDDELELYVKAEWSPLIDALLEGKAITFSRFELPPNHPQAAPPGVHVDVDVDAAGEHVVGLAAVVARFVAAHRMLFEDDHQVPGSRNGVCL